jgi:hypothetical protein
MHACHHQVVSFRSSNFYSFFFRIFLCLTCVQILSTQYIPGVGNYVKLTTCILIHEVLPLIVGVFPITFFPFCSEVFLLDRFYSISICFRHLLYLWQILFSIRSWCVFLRFMHGIKSNSHSHLSRYCERILQCMHGIMKVFFFFFFVRYLFFCLL